MPRGWRDLDYVVASPTVRRDAADLPNVRRAMENSTPVATFGTGEDRIEIRRIDTGGADDRARGTGEAEDQRVRGTGEAEGDRVRGTETAGGGR
jgi:hypothetical protein